MIPVFLRSIAAQVRQLVESKRAVHVTEADAVELEMIAGLSWEQCVRSCEVSSEVMGAPDNRIAIKMSMDVTPADFAYAWLLLSRAHIAYEASGGCPFDEGLHEVEGAMIKRAAVCAELAVIAMQCSTQVAFTPWLTKQTRTEAQKILDGFGTGAMLLPKSLGVEVMGIDPHAGTIDGARAAWEFVVNQCQAAIEPTRQASIREGKAGFCHPYNEILDKYRRELEGMK